MQIQWLNIKEIHPYDQNPRENKQTIKKVAKSIKNFGWQQPIVVDNHHTILVGHTRYQAALLLELVKIPVVIAHDLDPIKAKAYRIADNKVAEHSRWEPKKLTQELTSLHENNALIHSGFSDAELTKLMQHLSNPPTAYPLPKIQHPISQLGDCWQLAQHRVLCGDAMKKDHFNLLLGNHKATLVLIDPPYGIGYRTYYQLTNHISKKIVHQPMNGDELNREQYQKFMLQALAHCMEYKKSHAASYIFAHPKNSYQLKQLFEQLKLTPTSCIIWDKLSIGLGNHHYRPQYELIFYFKGKIWNGGKNQSDHWSAPREAKHRYRHPTQKPQSLLEKAIIHSSHPNDIVLDCFGGSGSTLMACNNKQRQARIMECDPQFVDAMITHWQQQTRQSAHLLSTKQTFEQVKKQRAKSNGVSQ